MLDTLELRPKKARHEYDTNGRVIQQTQADGGIWRFAYTAPAGFITETAVTDPRGNSTTYRFNSNGYLIAQTDALGQTTTFERANGTNLLLSTTDPLGRVTRFTYDANGNVTSITDPAGNVRTFIYEPTFNKLTSITDPLGNVTTFEYDAQGNLTAITDPEQNLRPEADRLKTLITYNQFGRPISSTDPLGNTTAFTYDSLGNLAAISDPLGNSTTRTYDGVSRLILQTDPRGKSSRFLYDSLNRITQIVDALSGATTFTYDGNGNLLTVTDARGNATTHTYDSMDRLATRADPLSRSESFLYDPNGNLVQFTDRKGQVSTLSYDPLNRRIRADFADGTFTEFTYDAGERLIQASDSATGAILQEFDVLDRLLRETTAQGSVTYAYDALGRRTGMTVDGQAPVSYSYDANARLTQVAQGAQTVAMSYDALDRRTLLTLPNGVSTEYQYDAASRLTALIYRNVLGVLGDLTYQYDAAGSRVAVGGSFARTLLPDPVLSTTYDAANEQLAFGDKTMTFDANGNLETVTDPAGTTAFVWDARNRLVNLSEPAVTASFSYDAFGRRTQKLVNTAITQYQYDGFDIIRQIVNSVEVAYLRSLEMDEPFVRQSTTNEHSLTDALGSVLALSDDVGTVQATYSYNPFGPATINGTSTNPFQYTGRENDGTGLYYYRARYYSPLLQRFVSEDPIGLAGGQINLYAYVGNNPVTFTDPTGLVVDIIADVLFIGYDLVRLAVDGRKGRGENLTALGLDLAGLIIPGVTGLGPASRAARGSVKGIRALKNIGRAGKGKGVREVVGSVGDAEALFKQLSRRGTPVKAPRYPGNMVELPNGARVGFRPKSTLKGGPPTVDVNIPGQKRPIKIKFVDK